MNQLDKPSYTVFINSNDKVSGTNNNANYQINWSDFLPNNVDKYKLVFSFQTAGGYYKDNFSNFQISAIGITTTPSFQCAVASIYSSSSNTTSILISVISGFLMNGNYVTINGTSYNIINSTVTTIGQVLYISGNPVVTVNTTYYGGVYTSVTANTIANYTGSLTTGQTINYNNNSFLIMSISNLYTNSTILLVKGTPTSLLLPFGVQLFASNKTTYNGCEINVNLGVTSYSFDSTSLSQSYTIGYGFRDIQTSSSNSNCFSTFYMQNPPKTILKPNQNLINIQIFNNSYVYMNSTGTLLNNQLLVNTDYFSNALSDMTNYFIVLEFIPII
jgi:hypothetical protein